MDGRSALRVLLSSSSSALLHRSRLFQLLWRAFSAEISSSCTLRSRANWRRSNSVWSFCFSVSNSSSNTRRADSCCRSSWPSLPLSSSASLSNVCIVSVCLAAFSFSFSNSSAKALRAVSPWRSSEPRRAFCSSVCLSRDCSSVSWAASWADDSELSLAALRAVSRSSILRSRSIFCLSKAACMRCFSSSCSSVFFTRAPSICRSSAPNRATCASAFSTRFSSAS
mmetsp:Transcript_31223/g.73608  ORF Transcript_31223/g.73608 Transcript_31223/m.73608 type:complete len:225 (+) Transcript_31223:470-1144(+)